MQAMKEEFDSAAKEDFDRSYTPADEDPDFETEETEVPTTCTPQCQKCAVTTARVAVGSAYISHPCAASMHTQASVLPPLPKNLRFCSKCNADIEQGYICKPCNSKRSTLTRMFGEWPIAIFESLPKLHQTNFWLDDGRTKVKIQQAMVLEMTCNRMHLERKLLGGKYLPLGVYQKKGYNPNTISANCESKYDKDLEETVYLLKIEEVIEEKVRQDVINIVSNLRDSGLKGKLSHYCSPPAKVRPQKRKRSRSRSASASSSQKSKSSKKSKSSDSSSSDEEPEPASKEGLQAQKKREKNKAAFAAREAKEKKAKELVDKKKEAADNKKQEASRVKAEATAKKNERLAVKKRELEERVHNVRIIFRITRR